MSKRDDEATGILVVAVIVLLAAAVNFSKMAFPVCFLLFKITLAISVLYFLFGRGEDYSDALRYLGVLLILFAVCSLLTYVVGHTFGDSELGRSVTRTADAIGDAEDLKTNATVQIIDASETAALNVIETIEPPNGNKLEETTTQGFAVMRLLAKLGIDTAS